MTILGSSSFNVNSMALDSGTAVVLDTVTVLLVTAGAGNSKVNGQAGMVSIAALRSCGSMTESAAFKAACEGEEQAGSEVLVWVSCKEQGGGGRKMQG